MKTAGPFVAERRAALHSEALFARRLTHSDRTDALARLLRSVSAGCADHLRGLIGLPIASETELLSGDAANSFMGREGAERIAFSLGRPRAAMLLAVMPDGIDQAVAHLFGGNADASTQSDGEAGEAATRLSIRLMQQRIGSCLQNAWSDAIAPLGLASHALDIPAYDDRFSNGQGAPIVARMGIKGLGPNTLSAALSLTQSACDILSAALSAGPAGARPPRDPASKPFAAIGLPLRAVLSEARLPLSRIAALAPGDVLPLPIRRRVPLVCGETPVAWGTVGEMDDCAALRIEAFETRGGQA